MAEKEVKYRKDGFPKVSLSVFEKTVIVLSIVLVLATAVCGTVKWGFDQIHLPSISSSDNEKIKLSKTTLTLMDKIIPDPIELQNGDGVPFNVTLKVNKKFDSEKAKNIMDYLNMFRIFDEKKNELQNEETLKVGQSNITGQQLKVMALMKVADKLSKVKEAVNNILVVLVILDVIAAIFISYFIWKRADDRRDLRELQLREAEMKRVKGLTDEELKAKNKKKKKKKKK